MGRKTTAIKIARVACLPGLKTLGFPLPTLSYDTEAVIPLELDEATGIATRIYGAQEQDA